MSHEWKVGDKVAYYNGFARTPSRIVAVEKVYKTGNIVVLGKQFRPSRYDPGVAHQTGQGYGKPKVEALTPDVLAEIRRAQRLRLIHSVGAWLAKQLDPAVIPDAVLLELKSLMKAAGDGAQIAPGIEDDA